MSRVELLQSPARRAPVFVTPVVRHLAWSAGALSSGWLLLTASALVLRCGSHASGRPRWLLPAGLALVLSAWICRVLLRFGANSRRRTKAAATAEALPTVSLLVAASTLVVTGLGTWPAVVLIVAIGLEEAWWWAPRGSFRLFDARWPAAREAFHSQPKQPAMSPEVADPVSEEEGELLQRYSRLRLSDGRELVRGNLVIGIERGAKAATAHLAFCPPFAQRPEVELRPSGACPAKLKLAQVLPQGMRIEAKLPAAAEKPQQIPLGFSVTGWGLDIHRAG